LVAVCSFQYSISTCQVCGSTIALIGGLFSALGVFRGRFRLVPNQSVHSDVVSVAVDTFAPWLPRQVAAVAGAFRRTESATVWPDVIALVGSGWASRQSSIAMS